MNTCHTKNGGDGIVIKYGISGAEKTLITLAENHGFQISCLSDIDNLKVELKEKYSSKKEEVEQQLDTAIEKTGNEIAELNDDIDLKRIKIQNDIDLEIESLPAKIDEINDEIKAKNSEILKRIDSEIAELELEIIELGDVKFSMKSAFGHIKNKYQKYVKNKRCSYIRNNKSKRVNHEMRYISRYLNNFIDRKRYLESNVENEVNRLLTDEFHDLKGLQEHMDNLRRNRNRELENQLAPITNRLDKIKTLKKSNDYVGTKGELLVIKKLESLSDEYYLFNDLSIELDEWVQFDGKKLKTAQIDHLIVGPSGIYVIETKNWSKAYVKKAFASDYTPYHQIKRGSYVVYRYLNAGKYGNLFRRIGYRLKGQEFKVKSIIAITNSKLPIQKEGYVKVLFASQLPNYIDNNYKFLPQELVQDIASKLNRLI